MNIEISGLDGLMNEFDRLEENAKNLAGEYKLQEIFSPSFMKKHTKYETIDDFLDNCGFPVTTDEEFDAIPDNEFDEYVRKVTSFRSWEEMQDAAHEEFIDLKLGF